MAGACKLMFLTALLVVCASVGLAQETESAVITPRVGVGAQMAKSRTYSAVDSGKAARAAATPGKNAAFMIAPKGPPPAEVNRKGLEENAGPEGGKLLLRSVPSGADVFINGRLIGQTPMLVVVAPGRYKIDMRGARQEFGTETVGLIPKGTQTVVIELKQRYPSQVQAF